MTTTGDRWIRDALLDRVPLAAEPDQPFDRLTRLARALLRTPQAFVALAGDDPGCAVREFFRQSARRSRAAFVVTDARVDPAASEYPVVATMNVVSWAGFPVHAPGGEVLGMFCVVDTVPREWTPQDLEVLATFAAAVSNEIALRSALSEEQLQRARAETAVEDLRELNQSLLDATARLGRIARTLQESLLPPLLPAVPGLQLAARYQPAASGEEVMGDFYDVFQAARGTWSITLGDVCGKGPQAARTAALVRHTLRALALDSTVPAKVLYGLNDVLRRYDRDEERFVTVVYASLRPRPEGAAVSLGLAGHHPPLLRRASGQVEVLGKPGLPAGMFDDPEVRTVRASLRSGDALLLFTDGVVEARRGSEQFGLSRLRALVADPPHAGAAGLADRVERAVADFREGAPRDDTAVLVVAIP